MISDVRELFNIYFFLHHTGVYFLNLSVKETKETLRD